jgi:FixJ family two-component response regulator
MDKRPRPLIAVVDDEESVRLALGRLLLAHPLLIVLLVLAARGPTK